MVKPYELVEAELVYNLCKTYSSLPEVGGVLDQPVSIIRMHGILDAAGFFEQESA